MKIVRTRSEYESLQLGHDIGFVPTMGALHRGHGSLVERCRRECETVVVSIFVNPTQFNDPKDLEHYPRTELQDVALLEAAGVDVLFAPTVEVIYPEPDTRQFDFGPIEQVMEGASRPGHFNGVAQVVSRFFDIVKPAKAYFGEKDYQQLAIIRQMVDMLHVPVEIMGCEIVRDADGLALSSRNMLLNEQQRAAAPHIYRVLSEMSIRGGDVTALEELAAERINENEHLRVEYVTIADSKTLQKSENLEKSRIFAAVRCGKIRLIDNVECK